MPNKTVKASPAKKEPAKKANGKGPLEKEKKSLKSVEKSEIDELEVKPPVEAEDAEEEEEVEHDGSQAGGNAAAIAAASGNTTEMSASFKNFRHHPDMENFYRFIYENDLRHEALAIIDEIMVEKQNRKQGGKPVKPH
jgi:hypothetical protein